MRMNTNESQRRYHNLLYIPFGSGSTNSNSPIEYLIYPIGLKKGQVRRLEDEYQRFIQIYQEIIIRLEKLESLLSDAERVVALTRISQVQDELRSVRTQLDELLNLGQDLVSKSDKYSKLVAPDIENITRKFEDLQRRIRLIQETQEKRSREQQTQQFQSTHDDVRQEVISEKRYNRFEREARHRSPSESSEMSTSHGVIDEDFKKKYLRCIAYMKLIERLYDNRGESDEEVDVNTSQKRLSRRDRTTRDRPEYEEIEKIIRETEERAFVIEKTDAEQARRIREKIYRLRECLDNLKYRSNQFANNEDVIRYNERYEERIQTAATAAAPREREFDSDFIYDIDDTRSIISEPAPVYNGNRFRKTVHSLERYQNLDDRSAPAAPAGYYNEYQLQPLVRVRSLKAIDHRTLSAPSSPVLQHRHRSQHHQYQQQNHHHHQQHQQHQNQHQNQQYHHYQQQQQQQNSISKSASMPNGGFPVLQQPILYRERVIDRHVAERSTSRGESHRQQQEKSAIRGSGVSTTGATTATAGAAGQSATLNRSLPVRYEEQQWNGSYRQQGIHPTRIVH